MKILYHKLSQMEYAKELIRKNASAGDIVLLGSDKSSLYNPTELKDVESIRDGMERDTSFMEDNKGKFDMFPSEDIFEKDWLPRNPDLKRRYDEIKNNVEIRWDELKRENNSRNNLVLLNYGSDQSIEVGGLVLRTSSPGPEDNPRIEGEDILAMNGCFAEGYEGARKGDGALISGEVFRGYPLVITPAPVNLEDIVNGGGIHEVQKGSWLLNCGGAVKGGKEKDGISEKLESYTRIDFDKKAGLLAREVYLLNMEKDGSVRTDCVCAQDISDGKVVKRGLGLGLGGEQKAGLFVLRNYNLTEKVNHLVKLGAELYVKGDTSGALELFERAHSAGRTDDDRKVCYAWLGRAYSQMGEDAFLFKGMKFNKAIKMGRRAISLFEAEGKRDELYASVQHGLGRVYHAIGRNDKAAEAFDAAQSISPNSDSEALRDICMRLSGKKL